MTTKPLALALRAKVFGALIRGARLAADKQIEDCARAIDVSNETFESYELGKKPISLPELEGLAYYLDIPLEHFWGSDLLFPEDGHKQRIDMNQFIRIRHRMIGALLRQARLDAGLSLEDLARHTQTQLDASSLEAYELAREPVPLPHLEMLSELLNRSIKEFQDKHGPVGVRNAQQRALQDFLGMPLDLQVFVSRPVNRPYLDLAIRLSEMSVDKLRAVAEGLLEITL